LCGRGIDLYDKRGLSQNVFLRESSHLSFGQLLDPVCLLVLSVSDWDDKAWYPGVVINDVPLGSVAGRKGNCILVVVQPFFQVGYFVGEGEGGLGILLFSLSNGGGKALGNVEDSNGVVLVELHHSFGRGGGDGSRWSRGGPYGG
jgi:hypothetical protein